MTSGERVYYGLWAIALICISPFLTGCTNIEGDGFRNGGTGYRGVKLCKQKTSTGERWFRC